MPVQFDLSSSKVIFDSTQKKVQYLNIFGSDNCCFLDPDAPVWNSEITYNIDDIVVYGAYGFYKSLQNNNLNHTPNPSATNEWWAKLNNLSPCNNANWNLHPPFGGIGKTPKYIKLTISNAPEDLPIGSKTESCVSTCDGYSGCCEDHEVYMQKDSPVRNSDINRSFILTNNGV